MIPSTRCCLRGFALATFLGLLLPDGVHQVQSAASRSVDCTVECGVSYDTLSPALDINQWYAERADDLSRVPVGSVRIWVPLCGPMAGRKNVFPGWKGVAHPPRYSFEYTDKVIADIIARGAEPFLMVHLSRMTVPHTGRERRTFARACGNLIRHLNDGPEKWRPRHFGVKYVELWNEPNLAGEFEGGTKEEFNSLYEVWSAAMRAADPTVKIGAAGYAVGESTAWEESLLGFVEKRGLPLDFLSWHLYFYGMQYEIIPRRIGLMRRLLDSHGLSGTEMVITEYNYTANPPTPPWAYAKAYLGLPVAAQNISTLITLEGTEIDICHRWTGGKSPHGLFHPDTGVPLPAFWAYVALGKLKGLKRLDVQTGGGFRMLAGRREGLVRMVVTGDRRTSPEVFRYRLNDLPFTRFRFRCYLVTEKGLLKVRESTHRGSSFSTEIRPGLPFVCLIELAAL